MWSSISPSFMCLTTSRLRGPDRGDLRHCLARQPPIRGAVPDDEIYAPNTRLGKYFVAGWCFLVLRRGTWP